MFHYFVFNKKKEEIFLVLRMHMLYD